MTAASAQPSAPGQTKHVGLLVFMATSREPLEINSVYLDAQGDYAVQSPPRPASYTFRYRGVPFTVTLQPSIDGFHYSLKGRIGHVPYTAQNQQGRLNALAILEGARGLSDVQLLQDAQQGIWVRAEADVVGPMVPAVVMEQTLRVLQEVRPFVDLLGEYV